MSKNIRLKLLALLGLGILIMPYQNCGSSGGNNGGLNLGSGGGTTPPPGGTVLTAAINPQNQSTTSNASAILFSAGTSGGTAPFTYSWSISPTTGADISSCNNQSFSCGPVFTNINTITTYTLTVSISDSVGLFAQANTTITVSPVSPNPSPSPSPSPGSGSTCTDSYGYVDVAYMDANCTLHVSGWGWNPQSLQNTVVQVQTSEPGIYANKVVSDVRDDVHNVYSCIPASPSGKPGFEVVIPNAYSQAGLMTLQGYVLNPNGSLAKTLNTLSINVYLQQPQCVYVNGCKPYDTTCLYGGGD